MGNNKYEIPAKKSAKNIAVKSVIKKSADVQIPNLKRKKGIIIISDNKFFKRLWFLLSNPFRYLFTGRVRY